MNLKRMLKTKGVRMIEIEIDGKKCKTQPGEMVIDVADANDIYIPRFCYHRKLSIAANCRMCLVQVDKVGKPLPACATPVTDGMVVKTKSKMALDAQKAVMEFLLINHPLDCPICDQGGECELQDLALGFGDDVSRYTEGKRVVFDEDLGPLVATDMTRCIHCTRCVRFGEEIAGLRELGATNRGENMRIGSYVKSAMKSEVAGNVIDLCPVGALTNKPFRFKARSWEMTQHATIAPHDCVGSNINVHTRGYEYSDYREIMRVVPKQNEAINEVWISDRDRYSCEAMHTDAKLAKPMLKKDGKWLQVDWSTALNTVVDKLRGITSGDIGALISPSATTEEMYLFQKLMRSIGCPNIDHRSHALDFSQDQQMPLVPTAQPFDELETLDAVFLIGSDVRREQPIANLRLRKAILNGGRAFALNPKAYDFNYDVTQTTASANTFVEQLLALSSGEVESALKSAEKASIILGAYAQNHPQAQTIAAIAQQLAERTGATLNWYTQGANAAGAHYAGVLPEEKGLNAQAMFAQPRKAYCLFNIEPEFDCANSAQALKAIEAAEFVVSFSPFHTADYADVILPIAAFAQTSGTYVNAAGQWQTFQAASPPFGEARPGWKVLRVLGNLFELSGFNHESSSDVLEELKKLVEKLPEPEHNLKVNAAKADKDEPTLLLEWPMFCVDSVVRRSEPLQQCLADDMANVRVNNEMADKFKLSAGDKVMLTQGDESREFVVTIDDSLPLNTVHLYAALPETAAFGTAFAAVKLERSE